MCKSVLPTYILYAPHVCLVSVEARRGVGEMELEFQAVVSWCVGSGNQTQFLCKSNRCSLLLFACLFQDRVSLV